MKWDPSKRGSVYMLIDPRDMTVRKIGITQKPVEVRVKQLMASKTFTYYKHSDWFKDMHANGVRPIGVILFSTRRKKLALLVERLVSSALRVAGVPIVNGEGRERAAKMIQEAEFSRN